MSSRPKRRKATARQPKATAKKATRGKRAVGASQRTSRRPPAQKAPTPTGRPTTDRAVLDTFSPRLREAFGRLEKQESLILKGLEDPEVSQRFLQDPAGALDHMGVEVPPLLRKRLRAQARPDLLLPRQFRLPNGQVVTPQITVRFTSGKGGSR